MKWSNAFIYCFALSMVFVSCSKEESLENGGGGGGSTGGALLVKVETTGANASTQELIYDSNNRLAKFIVSSSATGISQVSTYTITRDAQGRVSKISQEIPGAGGGSSETMYYYQSASSTKLKYGKVTIGQAGFSITDSVAYEYTGNNLTKSSHYYSLDGVNYELFYYFSFKYDARGNVTEQRLFQDDGFGLEELQVVTSQFDDKANPCNFNDDAFLEQGMGAFVSTNNAVRQTIRVLVDPPITLEGSGTYEYRSDGKPSKSSGSLNGTPYNATFTYR